MNDDIHCVCVCGSSNTFLGPYSWWCMDCGNTWPGPGMDLLAQGVPEMKVTSTTLPKVDEPHAIRHRVEDAKTESKLLLHDMGAETLGLRISALDFIHELTDWRIIDRNQQRGMNMDKLIEALREAALCI